jgi:hypothetical protein
MNQDPHLWLAKWYTRVVAIAFIAVTASLVTDYIQFGLRGETIHKLLHIVVGLIIFALAWNNEKYWKPFCFADGVVFTTLALIGVAYPNLGDLDTFNLQDTVLHGIVGISGFSVGLYTHYEIKT